MRSLFVLAAVAIAARPAAAQEREPVPVSIPLEGLVAT